MMTIAAAVERLHDQLPLQTRQSALSPGVRDIHRKILWTYATQGTPPLSAELGEITQDVTAALLQLAEADLVVLEGDVVVGAYPFTSEVTPHRIWVNEHPAYAMCSLDAVAIAPVFVKRVRIYSECAVTRVPVAVSQSADVVESYEPRDVMIGVRWQAPTGCAAHSMCREMVFLSDADIAEQWQSRGAPSSVFTLDQGVEFGTAFFRPLVR